LLCSVLLLAGFLEFSQFTQSGESSDESGISFRSISELDYGSCT
jgi:hypothetical protein